MLCSRETRLLALRSTPCYLVSYYVENCLRGVGASWEEGERVKKGACVACEKLEGLSPPAFKSGGATASPAPPSPTPLYLDAD